MGNGKRFNGNQWYEREMDRRTIRALREKNEEFRLRHAGSPDSVLLTYVIQRARVLGHAPQPAEVIGSRVMIERFGSWEQVIKAAGLRPRTGANKLMPTEIFMDERRAKARLYM